MQGASQVVDRPSPAGARQANAVKSDGSLYLLSIAPFVGTDADITVTPYGGKVELMCRMAGIPYQGVAGSQVDKKQAPRGDLPTLKHGDQFIDSPGFIVDYLAAAFPNEMSIFQQPSDELAAQALVYKRTTEEELYFNCVYFNWVCDDGFAVVAPRAFAAVPWYLRWALAPKIRNDRIRDLKGQGLGKLKQQEVQDRVTTNLKAFDTLLADKEFLLGDVPSEADAFLFATIHTAKTNFAGGDASSANNFVAGEVDKLPNLLAFHDRLEAKYFSKDQKMEWQRNAKELVAD